MSQGIKYLHSHSGLERELHVPKHIVLVDEEYKEMFETGGLKIPLFKCKQNGNIYCQVPTLLFVHKGGVFKNLND